jgi:hypothetical protein
MSSGKEIGDGYAETLSEFLRNDCEVPISQTGRVNISELARVTGIPKCSFYQNSSIRRILSESMARPIEVQGGKNSPQECSDVGASSTRAMESLERRANHLEKHNAVLVAENEQLRREVRALRLALGRQDMMIETGRKVHIPIQEAR